MANYFQNLKFHSKAAYFLFWLGWFLLLPLIYGLSTSYRKMISLYVKWFRSGDLGQLVEPFGVLMSVDDYETSPCNMGICCSLQMEGIISLEEIAKLFLENVLEAKLKNSKIRYPELRQYCGDFMGCRIWRNDSDFRIDNHVKEESWTGAGAISDFDGIHRHFVNRIFPAGRSPWELILLSGDFSEGKNRTMIVFRIHHFVCDSKSICKLLMGCLGQKRLKLPEPRKLEECVRTRFWKKVRFPYDIFLEFNSISAVLTSREHPFWIRRDDGDDDKRKARVNISFSDKISMDELKCLARQAKVRPSSIIHSVVGGALGRLREELRRPDGILTVFSLSKEEHPDGLINHMNLATTQLATDVTNISCLDRLRSFNKEYEAITSSSASSGNRLTRREFIYRVMGCCPNSFRELLPIRENCEYLVFISNQGFDEEGFEIGDTPCSDFKISVGCLQTPCGLCILPHSYKGSLNYSISANSNILDEEETKLLAELIFEEYLCLTEEIGKYFEVNLEV